MPRLLMTRPRADSDRFIAELDQATRDGLDVIYSPLIDIVPIDCSVDMSDVRGVIFTSLNGVEAAQTLGIDPVVPCYCVGARTTEKAKAAGWAARQSGVDAAELITTLTRSHPDAPLLHLRGVHARGDVATKLTAAGIETKEQEVYDQALKPLTDTATSALAGDDPLIVPLFSPRTARQFADNAGLQAPLYLAAISEAVAKTVKMLKYNELRVADRPDSLAMARCVAQLVKRVSRVEGDGEPQ
ncbi:uroporphyrinogen-III synthase [Falsiphaeobacter marinintestinus]|uniref:uroporphyrinogen-III synthase n=1 Tax=Falsiphaeobacter marinintestinus TaxID=1492905 RepID=UPI001FE91732|nr:uroporphyrinogen-III synthase [Phaeobacter marinintestinus]